jgi:hypothetical protein
MGDLTGWVKLMGWVTLRDGWPDGGELLRWRGSAPVILCLHALLVGNYTRGSWIFESGFSGFIG